MIFWKVYVIIRRYCWNLRKADQTLVGTALNLLGPAVAVVLVRAINTAENADNVSSTVAYGHAKKAFIVNIGKFELCAQPRAINLTGGNPV